MNKNISIYILVFIFTLIIHLVLFFDQATGKSKYPNHVLVRFQETKIHAQLNTNSAQFNEDKTSASKNSTENKEIKSNPDQPNLDAAIVSNATPTGSIAPVYPRLSRVFKEEGVVKIQVEIDSFGKVTNASILVSSGYSRLDRSALDSITKATFIPALQGTEAVAQSTTIEIAFKLTDPIK